MMQGTAINACMEANHMASLCPFIPSICSSLMLIMLSFSPNPHTSSAKWRWRKWQCTSNKFKTVSLSLHCPNHDITYYTQPLHPLIPQQCPSNYPFTPERHPTNTSSQNAVAPPPFLNTCRSALSLI
eukprot:1137842-Pelagomonas_calceolata.AAC.6